MAVTAAFLVTMAWLLWLGETPPSTLDAWLARCALLACLLVPAGVVAMFLGGLRRLWELPQHVRTLPSQARVHATEHGGAIEPRSEPAGLPGLLLALIRLGRLIVGSRDVLSPYAIVTVVLRPAVVLAALAAAVACLLLIPASAVAILTMLVA